MQFEDITPEQARLHVLENARQFCTFKDSRDWFFKQANMTLSDALEYAPDRLEEMDYIRNNFLNWYYDLRLALEEYEEYEWCAKLKPVFEKIAPELTHMRRNIANLQGQLEF